MLCPQHWLTDKFMLKFTLTNRKQKESEDELTEGQNKCQYRLKCTGEIPPNSRGLVHKQQTYSPLMTQYSVSNLTTFRLAHFHSDTDS